MIPLKSINKYFYTYCFVFILKISNGQYNYASYVEHLISHKLYLELESEKHQLIDNYSHENASTVDSALMKVVDYYFYLNMIDSSMKLADIIINHNSPLKCTALTKKKYFYLLKNKDLFNDISENTCNDEFLADYNSFIQSGYYLLKYDYKRFDSLYIKKYPIVSNEQIRKEFEYLNYLRNKKIKNKKALIAALLSAFVPGLGKTYTGNNGQALSMFLTNALFAGLTIENYLRMGKYHPQTLIFATGFITFYLANIYGSAISVKYYKIEKNAEFKNNILLSLRIPLYHKSTNK